LGATKFEMIFRTIKVVTNKVIRHRAWREDARKITKKMTEENRRKISQSRLGIKLTEQHKRNISQAKKGIPLTEKNKIALRVPHGIRTVGSGTMLRGRFGELANSWKGGLPARKKQELRNDSAYQGWVQEIKKRDLGICRLQNENCMGYKVVHHILSWRDYPEERYNINNGITLCQFHHPRKRMDEQRLIPTFQEMVGSK
jgi:hypothetical protein